MSAYYNEHDPKAAINVPRHGARKRSTSQAAEVAKGFIEAYMKESDGQN